MKTTDRQRQADPRLLQRAGALVLGILLLDVAGAAARPDAHALIARFHAAAAARRVPGAVDTTPPVLHSVSVAGSVNATRAGASVKVTLNATDDLSGVYGVVITLASPDGGQTIVQEVYSSVPTTRYKVTELMGVPRYDTVAGLFNVDTQPGTWSVVEVDLADLAGNEVTYTQPQLAALGNTSFTVTNSDYTGVAPVLIGGAILTPTLSLSSAPPGTAPGTLPLAEVNIQASENVTLPFAGIDVVSAYFCLPPMVNNVCADEFGVFIQTGVPVHSATTLTANGQIASTVDPGQPVLPGTYFLESVEISDTQGDTSSYTDAAFGGNVNLSALFGATTITVTP